MNNVNTEIGFELASFIKVYKPNLDLMAGSHFVID
ncbi:hypothetical protein J2Z83_002356 [Virgibacillus natechei]|uniref:Uncharacterized protein n=1 Tax=Virgibacillus natechei TaxID=1216297 RepID=A0ABS4IH85_9BACI|nr:hypothetical protein [Virgibacillus natechei]